MLVAAWGWSAAWLIAGDAASRLDGDLVSLVMVLLAVWGPCWALAWVPWRLPAAAGPVALLWWVPLAARGASEHLSGAELAAALVIGWAVGAVASAALIRRGWTSVSAALSTATMLGALSVASQVGRAVPEPPPPPSLRGPPLVLITLDTVRADHLARIGGARFRSPTPNLDRLMDRGVLFTEGVAPAPLTGPSHAGMLTGQSPLTLGVLKNGDALEADVRTVAEALSGEGWRTGAFVGAAVLDRRVGLAQGFHHYDDRFGPVHRAQPLWPFDAMVRHQLVRRAPQRPGAEVIARAIRWFDQSPERTFLWVHLYDAHAPYDPEVLDREALVEVGPPVGSADDVAAWRAWRKEHIGARGMPGMSMLKRAADDAVADYAAEIVEVDRLVGQLLEALPPDAMIVVASDHGESLTEQGYLLNHGRHAFQSVLRVPLIVVAPGFPAGHTVEHPVPSWLVGGTLRALAGGAQTGLGDALVGWEPAIESWAAGQEARPSFEFGSRAPELAVRRGATKWLMAGERRWRFDLAADPSERAPIVDDPVDLRERYEQLHERPRDDTPEWLEALGYVDP